MRNETDGNRPQTSAGWRWKDWSCLAILAVLFATLIAAIYFIWWFLDMYRRAFPQ
jgi:hypothetical protein